MTHGKLTVTDDEIAQFIRIARGPAVVTSEVATNFDMSKEWARQRLSSMVSDNRLHSKSVGGTGIYWLPELDDWPSND